MEVGILALHIKGFKKRNYQLKNKIMLENENLNKAVNPQLNIGAVIRSAFLKPVRWFEKMFCKHKDKTEIYRCYQDRYVSEVCNDCGKVIYSDL